MNQQIIDYFILYAIPLTTVGLGLVMGWIFKRFIHHRIKKLTEKTEWKGDDVFFEAIESHIVLWFFLVALNIASTDIPFLNTDYQSYLSKIIISILILSITLAASKVGVGLLNYWAEKQGTNLPSTTIFVNLARIVIVSVGVLVILQSLGISITPLITALGVGGLAVSLALKDTLSDLFGGINILLSKTMQEGDYVQLDNGYQGYVENVGWRYTTIRERANNIISIPNSVLSGSISKNFSSMDSAFRVPIQIGVSYDSDLDHVEKVALEVANEIYEELDCVSKSYKPVIRFREFADSSINFFIYFQGKNFGDHNTILNSYIKKLHKKFKEEKIDIPYPIRTLIHKNEVKD